MKYKLNKKRLTIIVVLMIIEIINISLAIRSYGNKEGNSQMVFGENDYQEVIDYDNWSEGNYKLKEESGCLNNEGNLITIPEYSEVNETIVMEFDSSMDCYLYFEENK